MAAPGLVLPESSGQDRRRRRTEPPPSLDLAALSRPVASREAGFLSSQHRGEHAVPPRAPLPDAHQLRRRQQRRQRVGRRHVRLVPGAGRGRRAAAAVAARRRLPAVGLPQPVVPQVEDLDAARRKPLPQGIRRVAVCECSSSFSSRGNSERRSVSRGQLRPSADTPVVGGGRLAAAVSMTDNGSGLILFLEVGWRRRRRARDTAASCSALLRASTAACSAPQFPATLFFLFFFFFLFCARKSEAVGERWLRGCVPVTLRRARGRKCAQQLFSPAIFRCELPALCTRGFPLSRIFLFHWRLTQHLATSRPAAASASGLSVSGGV
ncbi:hypothetical protein HPB48_008736 [Haemaphysalis longicornis]|uniref:Uncharacterized protein n=1 Tax=Haemaphysalis longicornis TaxID=44386 RepID=A0A9J6G552_HAELO|nr:hypothetical protein HPB48_008736 [Haemaphysalis longicornis]